MASSGSNFCPRPGRRVRTISRPRQRTSWTCLRPINRNPFVPSADRRDAAHAAIWLLLRLDTGLDRSHDRTVLEDSPMDVAPGWLRLHLRYRRAGGGDMGIG